jgi:hypothetical protein
MRRAYAQREFDKPGWSKCRVYSWTAYRDRSQICAIESWGDLFGLKAYERPCVDREPETTLLRALQEGELKAVGSDGKEIVADYWLGKEARDIGDDVIFRRMDVLRVWRDPLDPAVSIVDGVAEQRRSSPRPAKARAAAKAHMEANYPAGLPRGVTYKVIARAVGVGARTVRRARRELKEQNC